MMGGPTSTRATFEGHTCRRCGGELPKGRWAYCSSQCSLRDHNRMCRERKWSRLPPRPPCELCGADMASSTRHRSAIYCSDECSKRAHLENAKRQRSVQYYGITREEIAARLAEQGGCAICGTDDPRGRGTWSVDHDHACCPHQSKTCGKCIRGILCTPCNLAIGQFGENVQALRNAASYLEKWNRKGAA